MSTEEMRSILKEQIENADAVRLEELYAALINLPKNVDAERRNLVNEERERYLKQEGRSYSWEEVKSRALDKGKRNDLHT